MVEGGAQKQLSILGYKIFRRVRGGAKIGGGIALVTKKSVNAAIRMIFWREHGVKLCE